MTKKKKKEKRMEPRTITELRKKHEKNCSICQVRKEQGLPNICDHIKALDDVENLIKNRSRSLWIAHKEYTEKQMKILDKEKNQDAFRLLLINLMNCFTEFEAIEYEFDRLLSEEQGENTKFSDLPAKPVKIKSGKLEGMANKHGGKGTYLNNANKKSRESVLEEAGIEVLP